VKLKEWDSLFPVIVEEADTRDPPNARKHAEELWQQLDHLGLVDMISPIGRYTAIYSFVRHWDVSSTRPILRQLTMDKNVVYWNADPSSPLAWEVDHWYPHSRTYQKTPPI
jgi:hypothetical protein